MQTIQDVLARASSVVSNPLLLEVATLESSIDVLEFSLSEEMNRPFLADITVTSLDKQIDSALVVGRPAIFKVDVRASVSGLIDPVQRTARIVHGVVTRWTRVKTTRDEATYRLHLRPRLALLEEIHDSAVFQDRTLQELLTDTLIGNRSVSAQQASTDPIVACGTFESYDVEFALEGLDTKYEQTLMYEETVGNFIDRHCRRSGVYYYFKHAGASEGPQRDTLVFGNTPRGYMRSLEVPIVPYSGTLSEHEAILSLEVTRELVAQTVREWDHNYRSPDDPLKVESVVAQDDRSVFGSVNRSIEHFHSVDEGKVLADVRRDELLTKQTRITGKSNVTGMMPGMVVRISEDAPAEAPHGIVITKLVTTGSRQSSIVNEFEAIPAHVTYRPEYVPQKHWRWVSGTLIGTIESCDDKPYAWLDEYGRYRVKFQFARRTQKRGTNSMLLRLLRTSASYQGGLHSPLLPGTEVRIGATQGNIDRVYIAGALHDYSQCDPVHGKEGWYSRAVWRSPLLGNKIRFDDLKGSEGAKVASVFAKSSMSLGYLVDGTKKKRGEGFELATRAWGTVRGEKGLFWSADPFTNENASQVEMQAALSQLRAALDEAESMRTLAQQATAELAEVKAQQALLEDSFKDLQKAVILLSAPDGIGAVTPKSIQLSGGEHLTATAGANTDFSVGHNFTVASGKAISLFANQNGIKALAANGKVDVQAQRGEMSLISNDGMSIASANGRVTISANEELLLVCGSSYLRITPSGIEDGTHGDRTIHSASYQKLGPQGVSTAIPSLPSVAGNFDQAYVVNWSGTQIPASNAKYQLFSEGKLIAEGVTNANGETSLAKSHVPQNAVLNLLED
ncbi:type VI secretion system Vgr family protein [Pandoraea sp.]|uniref:type VI secretion system Vgr family protein n=1 Tax=Pandoraea sp. TaxID=1883445 RepID=UPI0035B31DFA